MDTSQIINLSYRLIDNLFPVRASLQEVNWRYLAQPQRAVVVVIK